MRVALLGEDDRVARAIARGGGEIVRTLRGAKVVVACGCGEEALESAIAAGIPYIDDATGQDALKERYERFEAAARHAGVCAVPGMTLACALGDLAAGVAAAELDDDVDEVAIGYEGLHRSLLAAAAGASYVWQHERWDVTTPAAERRRLAGHEMVSLPSGEVITVPRHVRANRVATFESPEGGDWVAGVARALAPALPWLARAGAALLAPPPDPRPRGFAIHAVARRGFDEATVSLSGRDAAAIAAEITAWAALALAKMERAPVGVLAPAEVFDARALFGALGLAVTTSFAW